ncbi:hypothetical protein TWF481_006740 [Arthrobotrys musiformis]|uniref:Uncharacterized protein n=1 Tax=Arthrobotrys musiformis TaxID=47236 RepID=A0AAV9W9E8_9PEZI
MVDGEAEEISQDRLVASPEKETVVMKLDDGVCVCVMVYSGDGDGWWLVVGVDVDVDVCDDDDDDDRS